MAFAISVSRTQLRYVRPRSASGAKSKEPASRDQSAVSSIEGRDTRHTHLRVWLLPVCFCHYQKLFWCIVRKLCIAYVQKANLSKVKRVYYKTPTATQSLALVPLWRTRAAFSKAERPTNRTSRASLDSSREHSFTSTASGASRMDVDEDTRSHRFSFSRSMASTRSLAEADRRTRNSLLGLL